MRISIAARLGASRASGKTVSGGAALDPRGNPPAMLTPAEVGLLAPTTPAMFAVLALAEMRGAGISLTPQGSEVHSPCLAHQE